jgi:hypothetical protein
MIKTIKTQLNNKVLKRRVNKTTKLGNKISKKTNKTKKQKKNYKIKINKTKKQVGNGLLRSTQCMGINPKLSMETKIICKLRHVIKSNFENNKKKKEGITDIINNYIKKNILIIHQNNILSSIELFSKTKTKTGTIIKIEEKTAKDQLIEALCKIPNNNTYFNIQIILSNYCSIKGTTAFAKYGLFKVGVGALT